MVQNSKFHGLSTEDPLQHLDKFDRVCDLTKINGVSEENFKLRFFPFSLGDKAHQWEKNLKRGSIQTWEQCKLAFLSKFFSTSRTTKLRNQILSFTQHNNESIGEAGRGLEATQTNVPIMDFLRLHPLANRTEGSSKEQRMEKDIRELQSKHDKVLVATQKPLHFVGEFDDQSPSFDNVNEEGLTQEELNYIGKQNRFQRYNNFNTNQNLSYRSTNVANPQDQVYPPQQGQQKFVHKNQFQGNYQPKQHFVQQPQGYGQQQPQIHENNFNSQPQQHKYPPTFGQQQLSQPQPVQEHQMGSDLCGVLQQLLQGQQRVESSFYDLGSKYETMQQKIIALEKNQASSSRQQGTLPGKPEPNPKEYCNARTLRSGKELPEREPRQVLIEDNEQVGGEAAQRIEQENQVAENDKSKEVEQDVVPEKPYVPPPTYQPILLFPGRFKKPILDKARAIFEKQLEKTQFTTPIIEAFLMVPQLGKLLKDAILNKTKELQGMVILSHECSAIIKKRTVPRKLSDPGTFTLP
ncbi:uncharacterized protein LOC112088908 [Eutrema salsugineum]|uniref:uncharacterized protein LOC112088908 n=1 Tax=Eutrema salsugineum TaxID=72664 RepID=UPI000CED796B|nr:uncharacterized protein LOC112088908 [Eutrema salsugineum]